MKRLLLAATLILLPLTAQAHTAEELRAWEHDWKERAAVRLTPRLMAERVDMMSRHAQKTPLRASSSVSRSMGTNSGQWEPLVSAYFPPAEVGTALRIIACESGGNPNADNPRSSARGLFQVLASLWASHFGVSAEALYDPETNTRLAYEIWKMQGWRAWSCYGR